MTQKVVFPSFRQEMFSAAEMRQLVSALEIRFQSLEQDDYGLYSYDTNELDLRYAQIGHTHVSSEITDLNTSIFGLDDVTGTPSIGEGLIWNGTAFETTPISGGGASNLNDLTDVNAFPTDGQALVWDVTTLRWIAADPPSGGVDTLVDLTDTDLAGQLQGDLMFNADGTEWQSTGTKFQWVPDQYVQLGYQIGINWYSATFSSVELLTFSGGISGDVYWNSVGLYTRLNGTDGSTSSFNSDDDNAHILVPTNGAQIDTAQSKFGGSSILLDNTGAPAFADYVRLNDYVGMELLGNDFTVEAWIRLASLPTTSVDGGFTIIAHYQNSGNLRGWWFKLDDSNALEFAYSTDGITVDNVCQTAFSFAVDTWYAVAAVRDGNSVYLYVDGTRIGTHAVSGSVYDQYSAFPYIGLTNTSSGFRSQFDGWIDEIRLTVGVARYTGATYTLQTDEFPTVLGATEAFTVGDPAYTTTIDGTTTTVTGNAVVDGATDLGSTLNVVGATDLGSTLNVDGAATFQSTTEHFNGSTWNVQTGISAITIDGNVGDTTTPLIDILNTGTNLDRRLIYFRETADQGFYIDGDFSLPNPNNALVVGTDIVGAVGELLWLEQTGNWRFGTDRVVYDYATRRLTMPSTDIDLGSSAFGDRINFYGGFGASNSAAIGNESTDDLFYRSQAIHRWYINQAADSGANNYLYLNVNELGLERDIDFFQADAATATHSWRSSWNSPDYDWTFTGTTDLNIIGLTGDVVIASGIDLIVGGDLTVSGTTTTINSNTVAIADNIILLNSDAVDPPTENAGIEIERGGVVNNVLLRWNETSDRWEFTNDGTTYYNMLIETEIDHTNLLSIGTNTHAQIDTHIADGTIHFTQAAISIPLSQINDVTATAAEVNLLDLATLTAGWVLSADTATTASWKQLSHTLLGDIGTNTHPDIDTHIADGTIHFTQAAISIPLSQINDVTATAAEVNLLDLSALTVGWVLRATGAATAAWSQLAHGDLSDVGTNTHAQIDTHIGDTSIHFDQIGELSDVVITTVADRHVLVYDGVTDNRWENRLLVEADISDLQAYLTAEVNDLSVAVTWANVPDANITQSSVTQHVGAIDHDLLLNFTADEHFTKNSILLDDLFDVTETTITTGDVLRWNGAEWVNYADSNYASSSHTHLLAAGATDVTATAAELNLLDLAGLTVGWALIADSPTTASWQALPSSGSIGGSITDNQVAVGATTANDIEGSANFTWDGTTFTVTTPVAGTGGIELRTGAGLTIYDLVNTDSVKFSHDNTDFTIADLGSTRHVQWTGYAGLHYFDGFGLAIENQTSQPYTSAGFGVIWSDTSVDHIDETRPRWETDTYLDAGIIYPSFKFETTVGVPATGEITLNNATQSSATEVRVHGKPNNWDGGFEAFLTSVLEVGDYIHIIHPSSGTRRQTYEISSAVVDSGSYATIPVTHVSSGGSVLLDNNVCVFMWEKRSFLALFTDTEAGLAPLSGGGTTNYLRADGTWAAPPGGAGSIGGSITDNQIAVGATTADDIEGSALLTWDASTLLVDGSVTVYGDATSEGVMSHSGGTTPNRVFTFDMSNTDYVDFTNIVSPGGVRIRDGAQLEIYDSTDTNYLFIKHTGTDVSWTGVNTDDFTVDGLTWFKLLAGGGLAIYDSTNNDEANFSHDGVDFNTNFIQTTDWDIAGLDRSIVINDNPLDHWHGGNQDTDVIRHVMYPKGATLNIDTASQTGAFLITLPATSGLSNMAHYVIRGYDYTTKNSAWTLEIGGYDFADTDTWNNVNAVATGSPPFDVVKFQEDSTTDQFYIQLGSTTDTHQYPKVWIESVSVAFNNQGSLTADGWSISLVTVETGRTTVGTRHLQRQWSDGTDYNTSFGGATDWNIDGIAVIKLGQLAKVDLELWEEGQVNLYNIGATSGASLYVTGADLQIAGIATTNIDITGFTSIQAGTIDADFDAITATSYGGITEANLLDKSAAELVTGSWAFNVQANAQSILTVGEVTTLRGDAQDGVLKIYGENAGVINLASFANTGSNLQLTGGVNFQVSMGLDVLNGEFIRQRNTGNTAYVNQVVSATPDLNWTFDGGSVDIVDWNITGLTGGIITDCPVTVGGDLTVSGTTTTINSNTVSIADNLILLNSDEAGAPTQDAGLEIERGTSANVFLQFDETSDRWEFTNDGSTYYNIPISTEQVPVGTTTDATLRWSGSTWLENTSILASAGGLLTMTTGGAPTIDFTNTGGPLGIRWSAGKATSAQVDLVYRTTPETIQFERVSDGADIAVFDPSDLSTTLNSLSCGAATFTGTTTHDTISGDDNTANLTIWGGVTAGANIELYGSTHASNANDAFYDADSHTFRNAGASSNYLTLGTAANFVNHNITVDRSDASNASLTLDVNTTANQCDIAYEVAGTLYALVRYDPTNGIWTWQDRTPGTFNAMQLDSDNGNLTVFGNLSIDGTSTRPLDINVNGGTQVMPTGFGYSSSANHITGLVSETAADVIAYGLYHHDGTRLSRCAFFSEDQGDWGLAQSWSSGGNQDFTVWMGGVEKLRLSQAAGNLTVPGDVSGATIGGITEGNLVDKTAAETIAGDWTFEADTGNTSIGMQKTTATNFAGHTYTNELGVTRWLMAAGANTDDDFVLYRYTDAGAFDGTALSVDGATGQIDLNYASGATKLSVVTDGINVTGTMAATTVTGANVTSGSDPGHTHTAYADTFDSLTSKGAGTGDYLTTGDFGCGENSGGVAMTINDGYGNANLTFNHRNGTPDNVSATQSACRIEAATDSNTGSLSFEIGNSTVQDTPVALTQVALMTTSAVDFQVNVDCNSGLDVTGNISVTGTVDSVDIAALEAAAAKTADNETITGNWTFQTDGSSDFVIQRQGSGVSDASVIRYENLDGLKGYAGFSDDAKFSAYDGSTNITFQVDASGVMVVEGYYEAKGLGPLTTPGTDDLYVGGYGIMGDRTSPVYVSNVSGPVSLGYAGVHGVAATALSTQQYNLAGNTSSVNIEDHSGNIRDAGFNDIIEIALTADLTLNDQHAGACLIKTSTTSGIDIILPSVTNNFPEHSAVQFINAGNSTVTINAATNTRTLYWPDGSTRQGGASTNRTIAYGGVITIWRQSSTTYYVWGSGIS